MRTGLVIGTLILCTVFTAGCSEKGPRETLDLRVGKDIYTVEIARTDEERQKGLMDREGLGEFEGMLFVFERDQHLSFWMKNTLVPLSIAYLGKDGTIREIYDMEPLSTRSVESRYAARYALELPRGAFERSEAEVGDKIDLSGLSYQD